MADGAFPPTPPEQVEPASTDAPPSPRPSRRKFLAGAAAVGAAGAASGAIVKLLEHGATVQPAPGSGVPAETQPLPRGQGVLVLVTLYGGNDGLNTVVPYADSAYLSARGDLAIRPDEVIALDDQLGLNPSLTGLKELWDRKQLAIVRGVGYPNPNRSHFRSMDIWQSGRPDRDEPTGWLGRWLDSTDHDPLRALAIGTSLPRALRGNTSTAGVVPPGKFTLPASKTLEAAFRTMAAATPGGSSLGASIQQANQDLLTVQQRMAQLAPADGATAGQLSLEPNASQSPAGANSLASQLAVVSQAIRSNAPTRVYSVSLGGFDTHAAERATHIAALRTLDTAVGGFLKDVQGQPSGRGVVVMIHSEFGRRVAANASRGTDHGTAAPVFVAGTPVRGGYYGDEPSLTALDQGDLKFTTDFRAVYATLLDRILGAEPAPILGGAFSPVAFL